MMLLLKSFTKRYQEGLETKMKGRSYIFERVDLLEYHLHEISLNRGSSSIDSPEWIKHKKVTINPQNTNNNNCFQYAIIAALNYQNINHNPERISNLNLLLIITIGTILIFQQDIKTILRSRKIIAILQ